MTPEQLLNTLLPESITLLDSLLLLATSFFTALITATLGVGGGVLLLAVTATVLPPLAIIPVHGLVQAAANTNRALFTRQHLNRPVFGHFLIGALAGAALASVLVVQLPTDSILLCVGLFILFLTWGPKLSINASRPWPLRIASAITTLISMFVGASGPLVAAFVHRLSSERFERVATFSACMSVQHGLKLLVFGLLGFAFDDWLVLVAGMVLTGVVGTWVGLNLLSKISDQRFDQAFKIILTLMALKLIYSAATELFAAV